MADFSLFFPKLLKFEGGFVNNPNDSGGATNLGITLATFARFAPELFGEEPTIANLKALTKNQAAQIYKPQYWDKILGDQITNQATAEIVADFAVNAGINRAVVTAQHTLIAMGFSQVSADGVMGPITLACINNAGSNAFFDAYKQARISFYTQLAEDNPKDQGFLQGWLNRVNEFTDDET